MPVRVSFGNWTNFVIACGREPIKPKISIEARINSIKARTGKRSANYKGGRHKDASGYIQVWMPDHPNCRGAGYIHEHRLIMSEILGRPLRKGENIHHKNGRRDDNRPDNLELWVSMQPAGQRVEDLVCFAKEILEIYETPELLEDK